MGEEQKAVETTAFDLQMNPARPGLSFHKLDWAKAEGHMSQVAGLFVMRLVTCDL
jgi:hypothetical protein